MNILKIDLKGHDLGEVKRIADMFNFSFKVLENYKKSDVSILWINVDISIAIAYKEGDEDIVYTKEYVDYLKKLKRYEVSDTEIEEDVELNLDTILDKISKYGFNALTKQEKEFLKI
jgi:hypothetical protein